MPSACLLVPGLQTVMVAALATQSMYAGSVYAVSEVGGGGMGWLTTKIITINYNWIVLFRNNYQGLQALAMQSQS